MSNINQADLVKRAISSNKIASNISQKIELLALLGSECIKGKIKLKTKKIKNYLKKNFRR